MAMFEPIGVGWSEEDWKKVMAALRKQHADWEALPQEEKDRLIEEKRKELFEGGRAFGKAMVESLMAGEEERRGKQNHGDSEPVRGEGENPDDGVDSAEEVLPRQGPGDEGEGPGPE